MASTKSRSTSGSDGDGSSFSFGMTDKIPSVRQSSTTLKRHDSTFSVGSDYQYASSNDLNFWQGAALLTADCLGTGILALPNNMKVLGWGFGLTFLILNVPINLYAGTILSNAADYVERKQVAENQQFASLGEIPPESSDQDNLLGNETSPKTYDAVDNLDDTDDDDFLDLNQVNHNSFHHDTATFDFVGMTSALFNNPLETRFVMILFYTNIFLVLGDYILVMSHAVAALFGEGWLCIPEAGVLASTLMFAVCQLRTMANLGRTASIVSLSALFIVIVQCIYSAVYTDISGMQDEPPVSDSEDYTILRKLSAMGSIGFAMGSQKLFLNIRHELSDRTSAPKSLAVSLSAFATFYVLVVVLSGPNPPSFLFDAIPPGIGRRAAGFFLWVHVVVSYAINSQAICSSMDRIFFYDWGPVKELQDHQRWMILTGIMAVSAFFISNAIPFFKDLVSLIGALTSIPLTLLLPGIFHRRLIDVPVWLPTLSSVTSYGLVAFSVLFTVTALVGALDSIRADWENHTGGFFTCDT